jgi:hypothetical protein
MTIQPELVEMCLDRDRAAVLQPYLYLGIQKKLF